MQRFQVGGNKLGYDDKASYNELAAAYKANSVDLRRLIRHTNGKPYLSGREPLRETHRRIESLEPQYQLGQHRSSFNGENVSGTANLWLSVRYLIIITLDADF